MVNKKRLLAAGLAAVCTFTMLNLCSIKADAAEDLDNQSTIEEFQVLPGDINGDGEINIIDYTIFRKYFYHCDVCRMFHKENADVNQDGVIDFFDLVALRDLM